MIKVNSPISEPSTFDQDCRQPGTLWLSGHSSGRPTDYWSPFRDDLAEGFSWRCGYKAMLNHEGTVDHYISCFSDRTKSYEWSNYRYVSQGLNSAKRTADDGFLDPFEVQDDWFKLQFPSLQLMLTNQIPANVMPRAENTVKKLKLINGPNVIRRRKYWYNRVARGVAPISETHQHAPLVARVIEEYLRVHGGPLPLLKP